jgi:hypothetical protein
MSTYTVAAAAGKAQPNVPTSVLIPDRLVWNGSTWVAAAGTHLKLIELKPGVVLGADVGVYLAAQYPSLITVT